MGAVLDTTVFIDNTVLNKPSDLAEARAIGRVCGEGPSSGVPVTALSTVAVYVIVEPSLTLSPSFTRTV